MIPADSQFLCKAVMLAMTILAATRHARQSHSAASRSLAIHLEMVLGPIEAQGRQLARLLAVPVAERLDRGNRTQVAALAELGGAAFEQMFLRKFALEAELEMIELCNKELVEGSSEALRAAAGQWLQDLRAALVPARRMYFAPAGDGPGKGIRSPLRRPVGPWSRTRFPSF